MKTFGRVDVEIHVFLTSALVRDEWSALCPGRLYPGERAPDTHWIGGCVGLITDLDDVERRKSSPYRNLIDALAVQRVASRYGLEYTSMCTRNWSLKYTFPFLFVQTMDTIQRRYLRDSIDLLSQTLRTIVEFYVYFVMIVNFEYFFLFLRTNVVLLAMINKRHSKRKNDRCGGMRHELSL
jgi:hypothetical protein